MADQMDKRNGLDRRRQPRGGRRPEDTDGFAPLVLLVGDGREIESGSEAILGKLKFAVARSTSVDEALRALPDLRPEIIVASEADAEQLRAIARVPVVSARRDPGEPPEKLAERILQTLRSTPVV